MGLLDRILGRNLEAHPAPWRGWDDLTTARRVAAARVLFDRAATRLQPESCRIEDDDDPRWIGELRGIRFRATLSSSSGHLEVELVYREAGLRSVDLHGDEQAVEQAEPAWDEHERRIFVDSHAFFEGSSAAQEQREFAALPAELQAQALEAMRLGGLRYFRSRDGEFDAHSERGILERGDAVATLVAVLGAAIEVTLARLRTSNSPPAVDTPERPLAGYRALVGEARWAHLVERLQPAIARALPGVEIRVVVRRNDDAVELRWLAQGVPVRLVANAAYNHLEVEARVANTPVALDLSRETEAQLEHEPGDDDDWAEVGERRVFIAPRVCVEGTAADVRGQVAVLRGLPAEVLESLLHELDQGALEWLVLEQGRLHTVLADLHDASGSVLDAAVRVGGLLGSVAAVLPPQPPQLHATEHSCRYCGARSFVSSAELRCVHCGAALS